MAEPSIRSWQLRMTHAGLACSLGLDAPGACAAAHAGLSRAAPLRSVNVAADADLGGESVVGHSLPCGRSEGFVGFAKALLLGRLALEDLASRCPSNGTEARGPTAMYLALSDRHLQDLASRPQGGLHAAAATEPLPSAAWQAQARPLAQRLSAEPSAQQLGIAGSRVMLGGHSALAHALDDAATHLASGRIVRAVVVAVDCLVEPDELRAAARLQRLKTTERAVGFLPGEAGVSLLLEAAPSAVPPEGGLLLRGSGQARCLHDAPPPARGRALAAAMCDAARIWPMPPQDGLWEVATGLNGDPRRADTWGHCLVAWQMAGMAPLPAPDCIAAAIGECGTAGPAAQLALMLHRAQRGWRPAHPTILGLASDDGDHAALVVH